NARVLRVDPRAVRRALEGFDVVVVAGFQGADEAGDLTTLGRGGSDTTAVALAAALGAPECEIFTDTDGVYTADPHVVERASKLRRVGYDEMLELASHGAKVLHPRSVWYARRYGVRIHVRSSFVPVPGTVVAGALGAPECEIFTDTDGVYTADPHVVERASKLRRVGYDEMLELASHGAKVLHPRSVWYARRYGVRIHVRSSFVPVPGTVVA